MNPATTRRSAGNRDREPIHVLLARLHYHKDAAYGDAWRRRGEVLGIFAKLARKHDRLERAVAETDTTVAEPLADTLADLAVYGCKYLTWIAEMHEDSFDDADLPVSSGEADARRGPDAVSDLLAAAAREGGVDHKPALPPGRLWEDIAETFERLEHELMRQAQGHAPTSGAYPGRARAAWGLVVLTLTALNMLQTQSPDLIADLRGHVQDMDER